ncbi:hypothetical protein PISMIDRAFT_675643 [Pisolithus microcarpus 441]|uniref:Uncharacterized protein n=1 Tax=Pisolithus microcarpus 441 TaxID=765257 RepID=A0A0C9YNT9_9AGAM|nr:hypothetical protein PISMIDRAFT_675643 [Pisolithus microcarpus 441]
MVSIFYAHICALLSQHHRLLPVQSGKRTQHLTGNLTTLVTNTLWLSIRPSRWH